MKLRLFLVAGLLVFLTTPAWSAVAAPESAAPAVYVAMSERPLLAIVALDDGSLKKESWWGTNWDVGSGLSDILTTTLLEKNRFRLLERSLLSKALAEQDLGASSRVNAQTAAKIGKVIGADYLVMGKVTLFSWSTRDAGGIGGLVGGIAGISSSKTKANVAIDVRIVDAETAEILGSYTGKGEDSRGKVAVAALGRNGFGAIEFGSSDFMNTILGVATKKAIDDWAANFCKALDSKKLVLTPKHRAVAHPDGVVLNIDGSIITANIGTAKGYLPGDRVEILKKGKELKDPDTGEVLKVLTELIGNGTITTIAEKTSDISFTANAGAKAPAEGDLVRYVASAEPAPSGAQ
jgi:curli biogenesis system outer membrane secretion channel CsgG